MRTHLTDAELFKEDYVESSLTVNSALKRGQQSGIVTLDNFLNDDAAAQLVKEALRVKKYSRPVRNWAHVTRTSLFTHTDTRSGLFAAAYTTLFRSSLAPVTEDVMYELARDVRSYGDEVTIKPLATWVPNLIRFHYMQGDRHNHAVIPDHTDATALKGLVVAIELMGDNPGHTEIVLADDTCEIVGIPQAVHQVSTSGNRVSMTFAQM